MLGKYGYNYDKNRVKIAVAKKISNTVPPENKSTVMQRAHPKMPRSHHTASAGRKKKTQSACIIVKYIVKWLAVSNRHVTC
jgi:hypothetical protein